MPKRKEHMQEKTLREKHCLGSREEKRRNVETRRQRNVDDDDGDKE